MSDSEQREAEISGLQMQIYTLEDKLDRERDRVDELERKLEAVIFVNDLSLKWGA